MLVRVMITRNGKMFRKDFVENSARTRKEFCSIVRSTNKSRVPGVALLAHEYVGRDGKITRQDRWRASLPCIDGTSKTKTFSVGQYGYERARVMAIEAREQALALLEGSVFRPSVQSLVVTDADGITRLAQAVAVRRARKQATLEERKRHVELAQSNAKRKRRDVLAVEEEQLAQPTNRTGIPYIGRYFTSETRGNWRISLDANGIRYRKTFSDSKIRWRGCCACRCHRLARRGIPQI